MSSENRTPIRFGHFSTGLQVLLILILVGSCAGGSSQAQDEYDNGGSDSSEIQALRQDVQGLERQVRALRRAEKR